MKWAIKSVTVQETKHLLLILLFSLIVSLSIGTYCNWDNNFEYSSAYNVASTNSYKVGTRSCVDHPPVAFFLYSLPIRLFGLSSLSFRAGIAIAQGMGILIVLLLYMINRRIWGHTCAVIAALLMGILPCFVINTHTLLLDIPTMTFGLAGLLCGIIAQEKGGDFRMYVLSSIFFGLSLSTKLTGLFLMLPLAVSGLIDSVGSSIKTGNFRRLAGTALVTMFLVLGVVLLLFSRDIIHFCTLLRLNTLVQMVLTQRDLYLKVFAIVGIVGIALFYYILGRVFNHRKRFFGLVVVFLGAILVFYYLCTITNDFFAAFRYLFGHVALSKTFQEGEFRPSLAFPILSLGRNLGAFHLIGIAASLILTIFTLAVKRPRPQYVLWDIAFWCSLMIANIFFVYMVLLQKKMVIWYKQNVFQMQLLPIYISLLSGLWAKYTVFEKNYLLKVKAAGMLRKGYPTMVLLVAFIAIIMYSAVQLYSIENKGEVTERITPGARWELKKMDSRYIDDYVEVGKWLAEYHFEGYYITDEYNDILAVCMVSEGIEGINIPNHVRGSHLIELIDYPERRWLVVLADPSFSFGANEFANKELVGYVKRNYRHIANFGHLDLYTNY